MKLWFKIIILVVIFAASAEATAGERYEFYNGVRSLAMGGAVVAVVNDETALVSNPAALGRLRNYFVTVVDPELEVGGETESVIGLDYLAFMDPQDTLDRAEASPGKRLHQRLQLFPSFVVTNFGFGVYARYSADAMVAADSSSYSYDYRNDYAFVFGFNFRLFDGRVKLGVNARAINRVEVQRDDIPVNQSGLNFDTSINGETIGREGFGVASDVGLMLTAPWSLLPTLAMVYRDTGNTSYGMNAGMFHSTDRRPESTPATLDVGLGIFPIMSNTSRMAISVEMVDVLDVVEPATVEKSDEVMRRLHAGFELNFDDLFFLRGGMNQGYWTAGFELAVNNVQLQFATYGEEVGDVVPAGSTATYEKVEDRRYVGKFSYRF